MPLMSSFGESTDRSRRVIVILILLFLASAVNYMDRQTLAVVSSRIKQEFQLKNEQYGMVEAVFGYSFAFGSLFWGFLVDRVSVRWVYPIGLIGWSLMGFLTGWARDYDDLIACRSLLGFFESAHWPCGLKTTQAILDPKSRAMGNSVLQSGTSIGAILTPLVMLLVLTDDTGSWRFGFQGIAVVGGLWVFLWLGLVRESDLQSNQAHSEHAADDVHSHRRSTAPFGSWWQVLLQRKFLLVLLMVICINSMWQLLRAWLPMVMQESYDYGEKETLVFNSIWYAATDVGCFASGALALFLAHRGWTVKGSRLVALSCCVILCSGLCLVPWLGGSGLLLAILLIAGAGALGIFPIYYSFAQDVSHLHLGKVTSIAAAGGWLASSRAHVAFGKLADQTGRFDIGLVLVGLLPVIPLVALWLFWPTEAVQNSNQENIQGETT
ncbi:MAG: MFS transporter [Planctomycetota bacterium]|jgi:ACS family hexuronate transporter-like MFS transporter